eukprot:TRINITY_DN23054_c0_g1_i1.p1 TRINITY_DN23054_c0_g1~~TRINITY_DN23054_c0_g1_i1.p1  ORF type:complete len:328 (+),score=70.96 TRINITY_DN23054_c0_g1_i1:43-1026(+)
MALKTVCDALVVGAGSIGVPIAMNLALRGMRVVVVERKGSSGQGDNKRALGGVRACHSDPSKIVCGQMALEVFRTWKDQYGDDIEYNQGGYLFPAYTEGIETTLRSLFPIHRQFNVGSYWADPKEIQEKIAPGLNQTDLRGGLFSPHDATCSPMLTINAFARRAKSLGVTFKYNSSVAEILTKGDRVTGVKTEQGDTIEAQTVIDCAGGNSAPLFRRFADLAIMPDSHDAAITEPVEKFSDAMVVDLRARPGSKNSYFYQNKHGQIIFCLTPDPLIPGTDCEETASFLPLCAPRILDLMPRLKTVRVRRQWRGVRQELLNMEREVDG